jgi:hypothetical protein
MAHSFEALTLAAIDIILEDSHDPNQNAMVGYQEFTSTLSRRELTYFIQQHDKYTKELYEYAEFQSQYFPPQHFQEKVEAEEMEETMDNYYSQFLRLAENEHSRAELLALMEKYPESGPVRLPF